MHPFHSVREVHAGRKRAQNMVGGRKLGGRSDEAEDKSLIKKAIGAHDKQLHGGKHTDLKAAGFASGGRLDKFARGGRTKHKPHTKINIVVAPHGGNSEPAGPPGGLPGGMPMPPPRPPMGPPPGMGGGMPPGMPPGGPPPMMRKSGGRVGYAKGGKVPMTAGADTGKGRLEKAKAYGLKPLKAD